MMKGVFAIVLLVIVSCNGSGGSNELDEGRQLAAKHCTTCHIFPEPALLDKKTWMQYVLPRMGALTGFRHFESTSYIENDYAKQSMSLKEWNKIVKYYIRTSPEDPPKRDQDVEIVSAIKNFRVQEIPFSITPPVTSFAAIFPDKREIVFADGLTGNLYSLVNSRIRDSVKVDTGISQLKIVEGKLMALAMGVMHPSDAKAGKLVLLDVHGAVTLLDSLQRPVHAEYADLNSDSLTDIIICEFGNNLGQLSWFEKTASKQYIKHILNPLPGAIKTVVRDFDNDGLPDIMAMMAQADEGLFIYFNEGGRKFREERILRFSPAHGSNYFELVDINMDGYEDVVTTNGDNGDYPAIVKNYHGIRIYLNDGTNRFTEKIFLPVNGVCKTITLDFDIDGDMDIASIAYFPDYLHKPEESFIYWENKGNLQFEPLTFAGSTRGRWLVMDAGDIDSDGDADIVLGNAKMAMGLVPDTVMVQWNKDSPSVLVLENLIR